MQTGKLIFEKKIIASAIIYFFISGILLFRYGIQLGGEAEKYIDNANRILNQEELRNGFFGFFYVVYSLLVAFFVKFSINLVFISVVQIGLSFFAAFCLYKLLIHVLENKKIAFVFFIAYLLCFPIQKWNFYLYSESVHNSFLVIGLYLFHKLLKEKNYKLLLSFAVMLLLILFSRPVGLLFFLSATVVMIIWFYQNNRKILFYLFSLLSIVAVIVILNSPVTAFINPDSLRRMEVICQVPEINTGSAYQEFNRQGLYKSYTVIKDEIGVGNFLKSGFKKLGYFFGMYRSYYSWQNNLLLLCYIIFYPFALIGIFSKYGGSYYYIKLVSVFYLLLTSIAIFFTCDDWANRFISPVFPFILILAAGGFLSVYKRLNTTT